jgi:hypothetical protein
LGQRLGSYKPGSFTDFVCITLAGIFGGSLHLIPSFPEVFESTLLARLLGAIAYGAVGSWVGVVVILGTTDSTSAWLRRFTLGVIFGFAGTVALDNGLQNVGLSEKKEASQRQKNNEDLIAKMISEQKSADDLFSGVGTKNYHSSIQALEAMLLDELAIVGSTTSDDVKSQGFILVSHLIELVCQEGIAAADDQIAFLDQLEDTFGDESRTPHFSALLKHQIGSHRNSLIKLKVEIKAPPTLELRPKVQTSDQNALLENYGSRFEQLCGVGVDCCEPRDLLSNSRGNPVSTILGGKVTLVQNSNATLVDGFVRLANRETTDEDWNDVLFEPSDPSQRDAYYSKLRQINPSDSQNIVRILGGQKLQAKAEVYVRGAYPASGGTGIVFSKEIGILHPGEIITVVDARIFTTHLSSFSQIWIAFQLQPPATL